MILSWLFFKATNIFFTEPTGAVMGNKDNNNQKYLDLSKINHIQYSLIWRKQPSKWSLEVSSFNTVETDMTRWAELRCVTYIASLCSYTYVCDGLRIIF